jgi:hypothetical protein
VAPIHSSNAELWALRGAKQDQRPPTDHGHSASLGIALSTNRKNRVLRAPATEWSSGAGPGPCAHHREDVSVAWAGFELGRNADHASASLGQSEPDRRIPCACPYGPSPATPATQQGSESSPRQRLDDPDQRRCIDIRPDNDPLAANKHDLHSTRRARSSGKRRRRGIRHHPHWHDIQRLADIARGLFPPPPGEQQTGVQAITPRPPPQRMRHAQSSPR